MLQHCSETANNSSVLWLENSMNHVATHVLYWWWCWFPKMNKWAKNTIIGVAWPDCDVGNDPERSGLAFHNQDNAMHSNIDATWQLHIPSYMKRHSCHKYFPRAHRKFAFSCPFLTNQKHALVKFAVVTSFRPRVSQWPWDFAVSGPVTNHRTRFNWSL